MGGGWRKGAEGDKGPQEGATATAIGNTEDPTSARGTAEEPSFLRPASLTIMTAAAPSLT